MIEMKVKDLLKEHAKLKDSAEEVISFIGDPRRNIEKDLKVIERYFVFLNKEVKILKS